MKEEALKLADLMIDVTDCETSDFHKAGQMIRKLVAELEEKEYRVKELTKRYAALDRPEQQKETYFCKVCNRHLEIDDGVIVHDDIVHPDDMVFTPQTKPLSDEEIMNVFDKCLFDGGFNAIEFARAIEERHGIK